MNRLITFLILLLAIGADAATVQIALTNWSMTTQTGVVQVLPVGPINATGGALITGLGKRINTDSNGLITTNLLASNYELRIPALGVSNVFFAVPVDATTNVYQVIPPADGGIIISGANSYQYSPGVRRLTSRDGTVTLTPPTGIGVVDLHSAGGGTAGIAYQNFFITSTNASYPYLELSSTNGDIFDLILQPGGKVLTGQQIQSAGFLGPINDMGGSNYFSGPVVFASTVEILSTNPVTTLGTVNATGSVTSAVGFIGDGSLLTGIVASSTNAVAPVPNQIFLSPNGSDLETGLSPALPIQTIGKLETMSYRDSVINFAPGRYTFQITDSPLELSNNVINAHGATLTDTAGGTLQFTNVPSAALLVLLGTATINGGSYSSICTNYPSAPILLYPLQSNLVWNLNGVTTFGWFDGVVLPAGFHITNRFTYIENNGHGSGAWDLRVFNGQADANTDGTNTMIIGNNVILSSDTTLTNGVAFNAEAISSGLGTIARGWVLNYGHNTLSGGSISAKNGTVKSEGVELNNTTGTKVSIGGLLMDSNTITGTGTVRAVANLQYASIQGHPWPETMVNVSYKTGTPWIGDSENQWLQGGWITADGSGRRFWTNKFDVSQADVGAGSQGQVATINGSSVTWSNPPAGSGVDSNSVWTTFWNGYAITGSNIFSGTVTGYLFGSISGNAPDATIAHGLVNGAKGTNNAFYDNAGTPVASIAVATRRLYNKTGSAIAVDWGSQLLGDGAQNSVDWTNRLLVASDGSTSLNWYAPGGPIFNIGNVTGTLASSVAATNTGTDNQILSKTGDKMKWVAQSGGSTGDATNLWSTNSIALTAPTNTGSAGLILSYVDAQHTKWTTDQTGSGGSAYVTQQPLTNNVTATNITTYGEADLLGASNWISGNLTVAGSQSNATLNAGTLTATSVYLNLAGSSNLMNLGTITNAVTFSNNVAIDAAHTLIPTNTILALGGVNASTADVYANRFFGVIGNSQAFSGHGGGLTNLNGANVSGAVAQATHSTNADNATVSTYVSTSPLTNNVSGNATTATTATYVTTTPLTNNLSGNATTATTATYVTTTPLTNNISGTAASTTDAGTYWFASGVYGTNTLTLDNKYYYINASANCCVTNIIKTGCWAVLAINNTNTSATIYTYVNPTVAGIIGTTAYTANTNGLVVAPGKTAVYSFMCQSKTNYSNAVQQ